jgi:sec-independent protein translocase protein TatA
MGSFSIWHWLIVLLLVMVLFGRGKISELMGDVAKGIKSFKRGMADDEEEKARAVDTIDHNPAEPVTVERSENKTKVS